MLSVDNAQSPSPHHVCSPQELGEQLRDIVSALWHESEEYDAGGPGTLEDHMGSFTNQMGTLRCTADLRISPLVAVPTLDKQRRIGLGREGVKGGVQCCAANLYSGSIDSSAGDAVLLDWT